MKKKKDSYYKRNRERMKAKEEIYRKENAEAISKTKKKYYPKYREKNRKRIAERDRLRYINQKEVLKIRAMTKQKFKKDFKCNICGEINNLEFHHWIYRLPLNKRDFTTLCHYCHLVQHRKTVNSISLCPKCEDKE